MQNSVAERELPIAATIFLPLSIKLPLQRKSNHRHQTSNIASALPT